MKYINLDKLKELIDEKWKELVDKNAKVGGGKYDIEIYTYLSVLRLIDSLQQEQTVFPKSKFAFPKFLYARTKDNKTIDVSYAPQNLDAIEYICSDSLQQEQPEVDLKKEIDNFFPESYFETGINFDDVVDMAYHFYDIGLNARKDEQLCK